MKAARFWNRKTRTGLITLARKEDVRHFRIGSSFVNKQIGPARVVEIDYEAGTLRLDSPWWLRLVYAPLTWLQRAISQLSKLVGQ